LKRWVGILSHSPPLFGVQALACDEHRAATKLKSFAFSSRASRLRGKDRTQSTTKTRRRKESPCSWLRLCCSVFICGFIVRFMRTRILDRLRRIFSVVLRKHAPRSV